VQFNLKSDFGGNDFTYNKMAKFRIVSTEQAKKITTCHRVSPTVRY